METHTWIDSVLYDMTRYVALNAGHIEGITDDELTETSTPSDPQLVGIREGQQLLETPVSLSR